MNISDMEFIANLMMSCRMILSHDEFVVVMIGRISTIRIRDFERGVTFFFCVIT